jgi:hypothetical protein
MHRTVIAFLASLCGLPMLAAADTVRLSNIPEAYWGTWGSDAIGCNEPAERIVLSGGAYIRGDAKCKVMAVSETPNPTGPVYSARLECAPPGVTNLIIHPKGKDTLLGGHDAQSLELYQRCATSAATGTEPAPAPKLSTLLSPPAAQKHVTTPNLSILPSAPAAQGPDQTIEARIAEWFKTCMSDWDQATHMTKAEWRATCRRVADERGRFVAEQQSMDLMSKGDRRTRQR